MTTIGLVPMAAKPFHAGHFGLIQIAAKENDVVKLYVSLSDRDIVSGKAMQTIWEDQIENILPANVEITYGGSPVRNVYLEIGTASESNSQDNFTIYSDPADAAENFSDKSLQKYAKNLYDTGRVITRGIERTSTVDVSGTKMRQFISNNDKESFKKFLPKKLDANKYWNTLMSMKPIEKEVKIKIPKWANPKLESLIREFFLLMIKKL
jgi:citrate lyase synthetase